MGVFTLDKQSAEAWAKYLPKGAKPVLPAARIPDTAPLSARPAVPPSRFDFEHFSRQIAEVIQAVLPVLAPGEAVLYLGGVFAGAELEAAVRARVEAGLHDRVVLLGRIPPPELPHYLAAADVVWSPSLAGPQYDLPTVDTKIFEGMAAGLCVLATNLPGRGEVVRLEECGLTVPSGAKGHLSGIRRLLANRREVGAMGERGHRAVARRYSWEAIEGDLVDFYGSLCAGLP